MACSVGVLTFGLCDGSVPIVCAGLVSFVMSFGLGLGPVVWLLPAELFPMSKRAAATGAVTSANWLANFLVGQFFPLIIASNTSRCSLSFVPFGGVLVFATVFTYVSVPETRGKTLEQIATMYKRLGPP